MCYIGGISFAPGSSINRPRAVAAFLAAGEDRGRDAAGYATVSPDGTEVLYKKDVPGSVLHVGKVPHDASAFISHTRQWTHGDPRENDNNHPIPSPSGAIRLVHNGVIYNDWELRGLLGKEGKNLPEVDSSVIPAVIEAFGLAGTKEIDGYAACAWFDRETDDTIHLARFKSSPVAFAFLADGSFAFASTPAILAAALKKLNVAWIGAYPQPFDTLDEGEYLQISGGEVLSESTVSWGSSSRVTGTNWHAVTDGTMSRQEATAATATAATAPKPSTSPFQTKTGGVTKDPQSSPTQAAVLASGQVVAIPKPQAPRKKPAASKPTSRKPASRRASSPSSKASAAPSKGSKGSSASESFRDILGQDHEMENEYGLGYGPDRELRTTEELAFFAEQGYFPDEQVYDQGGAFVPLFFAITHEGDYNTYPNVEALMTDLRWSASNTGNSENLLVGPDEGEIRWINVFRDIGHITDSGKTDVSWVENRGAVDPFSREVGSAVFDGMDKLRQLVGA